jgi:hypothetical protein
MILERRMEESWARTEWRLSPSTGTSLHWPMPRWSSFREIDVFLDMWNQAIEVIRKKLSGPDAALAYLVFAWIDINYSIFEWVEPVGLVTDPDQPDRPNWKQLLDRLKSLLDRVDLATGRMKADKRWHVTLYRPLDWLSMLAVLLMPEIIGVNPAITGHFLHKSMAGLRQLWRSKEAYIRLERERNLRRIEKANMVSQSRTFAAQVPYGFPKVLKVELPPQPRPGPHDAPSAVAGLEA